LLYYRRIDDVALKGFVPCRRRDTNRLKGAPLRPTAGLRPALHRPIPHVGSSKPASALTTGVAAASFGSPRRPVILPKSIRDITHEEHHMLSSTMTPKRRLQVAILGYLLLFLCTHLQSSGPLIALAAAVVFAAFIIVALRAAAPGLARSTLAKTHVHPIQSGKVRLTKRQRLAMIDRV
jgi:hypothetical protein